MKPAWQTHEPSLCATPWPEHVVASEYWHELPAKPASQTHEPSLCAAPWPEHVVAFEYAQASVISYLKESGEEVGEGVSTARKRPATAAHALLLRARRDVRGFSVIRDKR